jgi:hypothetical protein
VISFAGLAGSFSKEAISLISASGTAMAPRQLGLMIEQSKG